VIKIFQI